MAVDVPATRGHLQTVGAKDVIPRGERRPEGDVGVGAWGLVGDGGDVEGGIERLRGPDR